MGITVGHGGQAGTAAGQIIAQAGQRDLDRQQRDSHLAEQLWNQRNMQMRDIEARSDLQKQAADDATARTALQFGLDQQVREQEFDRRLTGMQEQARLQAQQVEYNYSAEQRRDFARFNNARQAIMSSDQFSEEEKQVAMRQIDLQQANIQPSMIPRDPSKPTFKEGQAPGDTMVNEAGSTIMFDMEGNPKLIQRWDQGPEAAKLQAEATQQAKQLELQAKREDRLLDLRLKLATEDVIEQGADGTPSRRQRTPEEVESIMRTVLGGEQQPQKQQQWWERAESQGLQVQDSDRELPPQVGYAASYFRTLTAKYGGYSGVPEDQRSAYLYAAKLLKQYESQ